MKTLRVVSGSFLLCLCISISLPGCQSARLFRFHSGNLPCQVEVREKGAEGGCTNARGTGIGFALWSEASYNYSILAQGLNSEDQPVTRTYGLLINDMERNPDQQDWNRFLRNPALLCSEACGGDDWLPETDQPVSGN